VEIILITSLTSYELKSQAMLRGCKIRTLKVNICRTGSRGSSCSGCGRRISARGCVLRST